MDEHLPALYTELLEISRKTIVLVIFLHWKLQPPLRKLVLFLLQLQFCLPSFPWSLLAICFCASFLWYCFESKMPDRRDFCCFQGLEKLPLSFSLMKPTLLNGHWIIFQNNFCNLFAVILLYFLACFFSLGENTHSKEFPTYLWLSKYKVCSKRLRTWSKD